MNVILAKGELLNLSSLTGRKEKRKEVGNKNSFWEKKTTNPQTKKVLILAGLRRGQRYTGERKQDTKVILWNIFFSTFLISNHLYCFVH